jgi:hypothetical protein
MAEVIDWPFPLPDQFLDALGYRYAIERLNSPAVRAHVAELLRRQGLVASQAAPVGPRRYVMLHWDPAGDELAWSDGLHGGAGQLNHWAWLDYLHHQVGSRIDNWLATHGVDLGSSDAPATHALVLDHERGQAWVAPLATACAIVRAQRLDAPGAD